MKKNIWRKQKGLTLLELLVAFAIFAIFIPAFITFARTAISNNSSIQNQTVATSQLKNAFNYITQDGQMAGLVIVNPAVPPAPANCVLKLQWINYPSDTIEVDYTLLNGVLTRIYTDFLNSAKNGSMIVATNVNPDTAKTYFTWSGTSLTVNLTVTIGNANEVRQFGVTPRVTQSSAQLADTLTLAAPNPSPASFGSTVTLTANFNLSSVKSGTVTFLDSNSAIPIGTAPVLTGGTATCTVSTLSVGNHTISAVFSGDAEYASSTSNTQSLTINQATTSTVVQAAPSSCAIGVPVTFTVNSLPSGAAGNVTFTSNISGDSMNIVMPVSGGGAVTTFTFSSATGVHTITATYSGDIDYAGSYGTVGVTIVYPDPVLNSISPTSCSVNPGAAVSLTANGSQFVVNISQVWFGATQLTVTSWSANQLIATIPTSLLTAASFSVSVVVKTPGATNPSGAKTFKIIGTASAAMSQLTVSPTTNINPDGSTAATLIVTAIDSVGNSVPTGGATVTITRLSGTCTLSGVTDVGNGTYTATAKSMSTGLCVFVATLGGSTVNNGGGSQAQVTVAFVAGNTINVTSNKNWSALTGGTGTGGVPGPTDLVIVSNAATLTVDLSALSGGAFANTVVLGNSANSGNLQFNSNTELTVNTVSAGYSSSCDVDMTSGGILVVGTSMSTGLTLTPGTGSINFSGAGSQTLPSDILIYNNLATVGSINLTLSHAITVNGTLNIGTGTTLDVNSVSSYNLTVKGSWTNTGTFTARSSTVTLSGSSAQTMTGGTTFYGLTVNNSSGLSINNDETVTNTLTLTSGDITTGSNTLIAYSGTTNAAVTANASSYVNGNLKKYVGTGANTVNFEVGTSVNVDYTPASVVFTGVTTGGTLTVSATSGKLSSTFPSWPISGTRYVNVYWQMTGASIAGGTYTANLTWINNDLIGGSSHISSTTLNGGQYVSSWSPKLTPTVRNTNSTTLAGSGSGFTTSTGFGYFVLGN